MEIYYPEYYYSFRCIAADCPDSCCKEWAVDVDADAAASYRALPGALGDRLRQVLQDTEDGTVMTIEDGRCPMWRQDGLCQIQAELGHDSLCQTCREFPRLKHDYGDFVELGLELSCPEAARLILSLPFRWESRTCDGGEEVEYDRDVMTILRTSRREVEQLLENTKYSVPEALAIILFYSYDVQTQIDGGEGIPLDPDFCLAEAKKYAGQGDVLAVRAFFEKLEILTEDWRQKLRRPIELICWSEMLRKVAQYLVTRYWLQAISDYDLTSRVKFVVISCLLIGSLGEDPIRTAQQFSKEIENDQDNIEAILDGAYVEPAFTDANLLGLLLK